MADKNILNRYILIFKSQFRRQTFPDSKDHRRHGDGLTVLHQMVHISHGHPDAAGRPDSVVIRCAAFQLPHNIHRTFILHHDLHAGRPDAFVYHRFQLLVLRAGQDAERPVRFQDLCGRILLFLSLPPTGCTCASGRKRARDKRQSRTVPNLLFFINRFFSLHMFGPSRRIICLLVYFHFPLFSVFSLSTPCKFYVKPLLSFRRPV